MLLIGVTQRLPVIFGTGGDQSVRRLTDGNLQSGNGAADLGRGRLTPRQAQILSLAANGLSDKQIAKRLGVTHRTVRTHFEKLFHDRGIRNRSQAIALWSARSMEHGHQRPADECPYPKPFPPDFIDCPAYQATQMVTLDLSHRPLGSVMTCRHLESRLMPNTNYRWYGACVLGDAEARRRWSNAVGIDRLHDISALRQEVSALSMPYIQQLVELKNTPIGPNPQAHTRRIQGVVDDFMTKMTALLRERKGVLDELHLPLEACIRLLGISIDRFVAQGLTESEWEVPDEVLALFPDDVRAYFRPRRATDQSVEATPTGRKPSSANS
jgi:DNA-binding CsgD family transcriptional regulator